MKKVLTNSIRISLTLILIFSCAQFAQSQSLGTNYSIGAGSDGTSKASGTSYGNVRDGDLGSYWSPNSTTNERISIKSLNGQTLNAVVIEEIGNRILNWEIRQDNSGSLVTSGNGIPSNGLITFSSQSFDKISLIILSSSGTPQIAEFETYNSSGGTTQYTVSTSTNGSGTVTGGGSYSAGSVISLTASPSSGYQFDGWSGDASGTSNPLNVTVNSNLNIIANFISSNSSSSVTLDAAGSNGFCGVDGDVETEHSGYTGSGYSNTDNASGNSVNFSVNSTTSGSYSLEIRYAATSSRPANVVVNSSTQVSSLNLPSTGAWASWNTVNTSINLTSGNNSISLVATSGEGLPNIDRIVVTGPGTLSSASCDGGGGPDPEYYSLSVSSNPGNGGSVSASPSGSTYLEGTQVTLTANPASGYNFVGWSGDASGSTSTISVTMNGNKNITALFSNGGNPPVNTNLVGWATQAGGTTGGAGGVSVTCSTGDCILDAIDQKKDDIITQPLTIYVNGTITPSNTSATKIDIKDVRDVSLIGVGTSGEFDGIGIKVFRAGNVIIQNVTVHHVNIGDKDAISIEGPADHVWVDHCELYAQYQGADKDYYDGLLDAKSDSEYITYSYNYLHDSWKMMLVGSSDSDSDDRKITIHHNYFDNVNSRMPLFRFGNGHIYNNYYSGVASTGINSRMGACLRVENNYFEDSQNPIVSAYSDDLGGTDESGNIFDNVTENFSGDINEPYACSATIPYSYSTNNAVNVPSVVVANAGVGKLSNSRLGLPSDELVQKEEVIVYPNPTFNELQIAVPDFNGQEHLRIVDLSGVEVMKMKLTDKNQKIDVSSLSKGTYVLQLNNGSYTRIKMFIKE